MNGILSFLIGLVIGFLLIQLIIRIRKRRSTLAITDELVEKLRQFFATQAPFRDAQGIYIGIKAIESRLTHEQVIALCDECVNDDWRYLYKNIQIDDIRRALQK